MLVYVAREPAGRREIRATERVDRRVLEPRHPRRDVLIGRPSPLADPGVIGEGAAIDRVVHRPAQPGVGKRGRGSC